MEKKQYEPDAGIGYRASYLDKVTGKEVSYIKLTLDPDYLAGLPRNANGKINLSVFPKVLKDESKRTEKTPNYDVKASVIKTTATNGSANKGFAARNAPTKQGGANDWVI